MGPQVLVTKSENNVCRLEFDDYDRLQCISYVGQHPIHSHNLTSLLGLPATYLNRILYRYAQEEIPDLIDFLQAPWTTALYHENFPKLRSEVIKSVTSSEMNAEMQKLVENVMTHLQDRAGGQQLEPSVLSPLVDRMPAPVKEEIQIHLLKFLER